MARAKKDISLNPFFHLNLGQFFIDETGAQPHEFSRFGGTDEFSQRTILGQSIIERVRLAFATFHGAESFNSMGLLDYIFPATVFAHLSETTDSKPLSWLYSTLYFILEIPKFIISSVMTAAVLPLVILYHGIASTIWYFKYRDQQPEPECVDFPRLNPFLILEAQIEQEGFPRHEFPERLYTLFQTLYGISGLMGLFDYVFPAAVFDYLSKKTTIPFLKFLANIPYAILSVPKFILTAVGTIVLSPVVLITHWVTAAVHAIGDANRESAKMPDEQSQGNISRQTDENMRGSLYSQQPFVPKSEGGNDTFAALASQLPSHAQLAAGLPSHEALAARLPRDARTGAFSFQDSRASVFAAPQSLAAAGAGPQAHFSFNPADAIVATQHAFNGDWSSAKALIERSQPYQASSAEEKAAFEQIITLLQQGKSNEAVTLWRETILVDGETPPQLQQMNTIIPIVFDVLANPKQLIDDPAGFIQKIKPSLPSQMETLPVGAVKMFGAVLKGDENSIYSEMMNVMKLQAGEAFNQITAAQRGQIETQMRQMAHMFANPQEIVRNPQALQQMMQMMGMQQEELTAPRLGF